MNPQSEIRNPKSLRLLVVEDSPRDAELAVREIRRGGFDVTWKQVDTAETMRAALAAEPWEAVLSDYSMPHFDGLAALHVLQEKGIDIPFILMSGTIGEDTAVVAMKAGAHDYLMKDNLARLVPALERELRDAGIRRERQRAEAALTASEVRYRRLFESAKDGILILDAETGVVVDVNPYLVELLGLSRDALLGRKVWELGFLKDLFANQTKFTELQQTGYVRYEDMPLEGCDGKRHDVEVVSNVYTANRHRVIQCNIRDISERVVREKQQKLAMQVLATLNRQNDIALLVIDILHLIKESTGFEAVGIRLREGDDFPYIETNGFPGHFVEAERHLCARDAAGELIRDDVGNPVLECMCGNVLRGRTDPTKPFFTERGSFWSNSTSELGMGNAERGTQARENETRSENVESSSTPHSAFRIPHSFGRCNGEGYESVALIPLRSSDETIGLLQLNDHRKGMFTLDMIQFFEEMGAGIGIAVARKLAAEQIRFQADIIDNSFVIAAYHDKDLNVVWINKAYQEATGLSLEQVRGTKCYQVWNLSKPCRGCPVVTAMETGESASSELTPDNQDHWPETQGYWLSQAVPFRDTQGTVIGALEFAIDITKHKKLQAQLAQAQKMESVGRLAGGVAHDLNNMLMGVMNYAELCRDKLEPDHPIREWLNEITVDAERSSKLTHQLLAFARKQIIAPKIIDINDAIGSMLKLLRRLIGEDITVNLRPGPDVWPVKMDPVQIDQILANLAVNARDAIGGVGSITIETSNATFDEAYCAAHAGSVPGDYALLSVTDSGCGMDRETLENIFEPFFTTKGEGEGTGLGLATVYGIVKQNDGYITVDSEPGHGTTFKIYLPRVVAAEAGQAASATAARPPHGTETVLLVEDEKSIRITTQLFLEDLGYTALVAEDPQTALRLVAEHTGDIHLLITDVVMPGMSGRDLANRLLELRPAIKRLFISGFTADVIAQRGILDDGVNFLSKPFGRDALARKVREVLQEGDSPRPKPSISGEAS